MFGLKDLSMNRLAMALLTVSAALLIIGFAAPEAGSISTLLTWLVGALMLLGIWTVVALELARRYFTPGGRGPGS